MGEPHVHQSKLVRFHRNVWKLFRLLVAGGYPDNETTMRLARRSAEKVNER